MIYFSNAALYSKYHDKLFPMFRHLLGEAKANGDREGVVFCYNAVAYLFLGQWDRDNAKTYIDSAEMFISSIETPRLLVSFYGIKANYIQRYHPDLAPESVRNYHNAMRHYVMNGKKGQDDEVAIMLRNMAIFSIHRKDTVNIQKSIDRIGELQQKHSSFILDFALWYALAGKGEILYHYTAGEQYLDTIIFYKKKCINLAENNKLPQKENHFLIDLYTDVAEAMSKKQVVNYNEIDSMLSIAQSKYNPADSTGIARIFHTKALTLYKCSMTDSAETQALLCARYLKNALEANYFAILIANLELLRDIYDSKHDIMKTIKYNDEVADMYEKINANEVMELKLQFEMDAIDFEIRRLYYDRHYQQRRYVMYIIICMLLALSVLAFYLYFTAKRARIKTEMELAAAENERKNSRLKRQSKQNAKKISDKYQVLSNFYLTDMQLDDMHRDLQMLCVEKEALDRKVENYRRQLESYNQEENHEPDPPVSYTNLIQELRGLLSKKFPRRKDLLEKLEGIDQSLILSLQKKGGDIMSQLILKYCICMVIGMDISEIADCFDIELSSVHMMRYRLKKKLEISDNNLEEFLFGAWMRGEE